MALKNHQPLQWNQILLVDDIDFYAGGPVVLSLKKTAGTSHYQGTLSGSVETADGWIHLDPHLVDCQVLFKK